MAIENITFDAATQQGLNATSELAKIGQTIQNAGSFIQNELEQQEVNDTVKLYREESEKYFRQANYNQKSFEDLHNPLVDKLLKGASNQRVLRKIQGEIDYKTNQYTGAIWQKQQNDIKQSAFIGSVETIESNIKEIQKATNAEDLERVRQIKEETKNYIGSNSFLDEGKKFDLIRNFEQNTFNISKENMVNKVTNQVETGLNYNNASLDTLKNLDLEKDIKNFNVDDTLKQLGIRYENGSYITEDGDVFSQEDINDIKMNAGKKIEFNVRKRLEKFEEADKNFNKQFTVASQMAVNGNLTNSQFNILENEAMKTGNQENVNNVRLLRDVVDIANNGKSLSEVMEISAKKYPNDFVKQKYTNEVFIMKRNAEVSQTADFWFNSGKIKENIRVDGGSSDFIEQLNNRIETSNNLANERQISNGTLKYLTTEENATIANFIGSLSPTDLPVFMNNMITKIGFKNTTKLFTELNEKNKEIMGNVLPITNVIMDNYNPQNLSSISEATTYSVQGSKIDRALIDKANITNVKLLLQDKTAGIVFGSTKEKEDKLKAAEDAYLGWAFSQGHNLKDPAAAIDEDQLDKIYNSFFGKRISYNEGDILVPEREADVVENNIKTFEDGVISKSFLEYNGKVVNVDLWLDGLQRGNAKIRTEKGIDKDGNFQTLYYVSDENGNVMANENGRKVYIPLNKKQEDIENEAVNKLLKQKENNSPEINLQNQKIKNTLDFLYKEIHVNQTGEKFRVIDRALLKEGDKNYSERMKVMYQESINILKEEQRKLSAEYNRKFDFQDILKANWSMAGEKVAEEGLSRGADVIIPLYETLKFLGVE